jgi:hypothetical protein
MTVYFYNIKERKYLIDDYHLLLEISKAEFSEQEDGKLILKAKKDDFIKMNVSIDDLMKSKTEITLLEDGNSFKDSLPKFLLEDCIIEFSNVKAILTPKPQGVMFTKSYDSKGRPIYKEE